MIVFVLLACGVVCAHSQSSDLPVDAGCYFGGPGVTGYLHLQQLPHTGNLLVEGYLENVPVGIHAIHVHESGNLGNNCLDTGGHYNPDRLDHGSKISHPRHAGDWGNFYADEKSYHLSFTDPVARLHGRNGIMGRSIVIHERADDLGKGNTPASKLNGNAGARIACCTIQGPGRR